MSMNINTNVNSSLYTTSGTQSRHHHHHQNAATGDAQSTTSELSITTASATSTDSLNGTTGDSNSSASNPFETKLEEMAKANGVSVDDLKDAIETKMKERLQQSESYEDGTNGQVVGMGNGFPSPPPGPPPSEGKAEDGDNSNLTGITDSSLLLESLINTDSETTDSTSSTTNTDTTTDSSSTSYEEKVAQLADQLVQQMGRGRRPVGPPPDHNGIADSNLNDQATVQKNWIAQSSYDYSSRSDQWIQSKGIFLNQEL
ncbi:MAG TPA: hypothetical protein VJ824_09965 [Bacillota bacterium]|nr:hypothetical protein [Bacillota bacterium]